MKLIKQAVKREIGAWIAMLAGSVLYAFGTAVFLAPNGIVAGGISSLATVFHLLNEKIPIGLMSTVLNIPILILGFIFVGKKCSIHFIFTFVALGIATDLWSLVPTLMTEDLLMVAVCGGIVQGIGSGLFLRNSFNGGTELLGRVVAKIAKTRNIPLCVGICDAAIVLLGAIVFRDLQNVFYALVAVFCCMKTSGLVTFGLQKSKLCIVISDKGTEIAEALIAGSERGVTMLRGMGMYTSSEHQILLSCIYSRQIVFLKNTIKKIDGNAFVIVTEANKVLGKGFHEL